MVNNQVTDYAENGELICFGLSSHEIEEWQPGWSDNAKKDLEILSSWFNASKADKMIVRPVEKSDFNWTNYATRA